MSVQIIEKNGKAEFAVIPIDEYNLLLEKAEELDDVTAFDKAIYELEVGLDEFWYLRKSPNDWLAAKRVR